MVPQKAGPPNRELHMSLIGSAISAGLTSGLSGGISSAVGSLFGGKGGSSKAMKRADAINVANYKHRYQWATQDLRKAGLNPILAVSGGGGLAGSSGPNTSGMPQIDTESSLTSARAAKNLSDAQIRNIHEDTKLKEAQKELTQNQTSKVSVEKWNISEDTRLKQKLQDKTLEEINLIKNQALKVAAEKDVAIMTKDEIAERILKIRSELKLNDQQLREMLARFPGLLVEKEIDETTYGEVLRYVNRVLPAVNSASGAVGAIGLFRRFKDVGKGNLLIDKSTGEVLKGNPKGR